MKKLFAILAVMGVLTLGSVQPVMAQDAAPAQTEQTTEAAVVEEGGGLHKELKTKFIEGDASFMSLVAIALVLGLAFCIERIIYLPRMQFHSSNICWVPFWLHIRTLETGLLSWRRNFLPLIWSEKPP